MSFNTKGFFELYKEFFVEKTGSKILGCATSTSISTIHRSTVEVSE